MRKQQFNLPTVNHFLEQKFLAALWCIQLLIRNLPIPTYLHYVSVIGLLKFNALPIIIIQCFRDRLAKALNKQKLVHACRGYSATSTDICGRATASRRLLALFTVPCHQLSLKPLIVFINVFLQVRQQLVGINVKPLTHLVTYAYHEYKHGIISKLHVASRFGSCTRMTSTTKPDALQLKEKKSIFCIIIDPRYSSTTFFPKATFESRNPEFS